MNLDEMRGFNAVRYQLYSKFENKSSIGIIAGFFDEDFCKNYQKKSFPIVTHNITVNRKSLISPNI